MDLLSYVLSVLLIGAVAGFLATWLGVGGCFLRIPLMMWLLGLSIKEAYCVNMAVIALTTIPGVVVHYRNRHVYVRGAVIAGISATLGVITGTQLVVYTPRLVLRLIFGIACAIIGIYVILRTLKTRGKIPPRITIDQVGRLPIGCKLVGSMYGAGVATGLCGFGGGIYYVPILADLMKYPVHIAVGTSSAMMILTGGVGAMNLALHGYFNALAFIGVGLVTLLFSWLGAKAAKVTQAWILRIAYGVAISAVGIVVVLQTIY
ncbi:MAG: hypothetical protein DRJ40_01735 [Thermoprotei archaeon]|nr:MAG: hypothetical protein DRJ40_01735 [Thermoprotei archaeon]